MPRLRSPYDWMQVVLEIRTRMTLSQGEFAKSLRGVTVYTVSNWETGKVEPQPRHQRKLIKLAEAHNFRQSDWPKKAVRNLRLVEQEDHS